MDWTLNENNDEYQDPLQFLDAQIAWNQDLVARLRLSDRQFAEFLIDRLARLQESIDQLNELLFKIYGLHSNSPNGIICLTFSELSGKFRVHNIQFPLESEEDFQEFENILKINEDLRNEMVSL